MNLAQKMIFRFLFSRCDNDIKNNSFLSAASTLHARYTYNIIIIIISWWCRYGVKWRAGKETRGRRASIIAASSKMEIENNYHPNSVEFSNALWWWFIQRGSVLRLYLVRNNFDVAWRLELFGIMELCVNLVDVLHFIVFLERICGDDQKFIILLQCSAFNIRK